MKRWIGSAGWTGQVRDVQPVALASSNSRKLTSGEVLGATAGGASSSGRWHSRAAASVILVSALAIWWCTARAVATHADDTERYYVSIGDSYAAGYRPDGPERGSTSRDGFAYQVADSLQQHGSHWKLVNFGCSGESAHGMAFDRGCVLGARAPDGAEYPYDPQFVAAGKFIAEHHDRIGLVTIVVGGNDVLRCLDEIDPMRAQTCAEAAIPDMVMSLDALLAGIRNDVGESVPIVGVSYINAFLADAMKADPSAQHRASASTALFENYLNPALLQTYSRYGAHFADTTAVAGGYLPQTEKTWVPEYGTVTASIGRICALTYYCTYGDVHPNRAGHALIAGEVEKLVNG